MRKTKAKTFSRKSRTTSLLLALLLIASTVSVGLAAIASAVTVDDDSGGLAMTGANGEISVPIESLSSHNTGDAFWVDASYYDYYSDEEDHGTKWLYPIQAGTGFDSSDDWYTFESFNKRISQYASQNNMKYPLYFGNFCNTVSQKGGSDGTYIDSAYQFTIQTNGNARDTVIQKDHGGPYARVIKDLYNYEYFIDNSNGLNDLHDSVIGLADNSLDADGNILSSGVKMPYFDSAWLNSNSMGKTLVSHFPFRQSTDSSTGVTTYSFDSANAKDNVFFNWSGTTPTSVGYGQGTNYGVNDGLHNFMGNVESGYGIFPFNGKSGNGGNNNLDYGFGIKMNMDFRIPANGTVDGTANGDAVTFKYSGDDDLWVYLSEYDNSGNLTNSRLVLDLGGNHKQAEGNINFKNMTSTITTGAAYANSNVTYKSDTMYIALSDGWSDVNVWAWDDGLDGIWVNKTKASFQQNGHDVYAFKLSDFGGRTKFTTTENTSWTGKQAKDEGKNLNCVIHSQLGNVCWSDNPNWIDPKYPVDGQYTDLAGVNYASTTQRTKSLGEQLDPDKTYHLTIFYMERGMIESNCMMSFTMTPVKNDFKVNKTVDVDEVNSGLKSAIQEMPFTFVTKENGNVCSGYDYLLGGTTYNTDRSGQYELTHGQTADFVNQHQTGSTLSVTETKPQGVQFTTEWNVKDNKTDSVIKLKNGSDASGDDLTTGDFLLLDPNNASSAGALQANFVNTPEISPAFTLSKQVFKNEADIFDNDTGDNIASDDDFRFKILVNLNGEPYSPGTAARFKAYNLEYSIRRGRTVIDGTATNGVFSIKADDKINFPGMPVGATYYIQEIGCDGYSSVAYSHNGGSPERLGTDAAISGVIGADGDAFIFDNVEGVASVPFAVEKYIAKGNARTQYKNGSLFTFRAKGLGSVTYAQGKTSVDATEQTYNGGKGYVEVSEVNAQGLAIFMNGGDDDPFLQFRRAGVYIFEVEESAVSSGYANAFTKSSQKFLVKYTMEAVGTSILPASGTPEYYTYDGGAITPATFSANNKVDAIRFVNEVKTGKITINKKDGKNAGLGGVKFKLYVKNGDDKTEVATLTTNNNGVATLDNLDIYTQNNGVYTGDPELQVYELTEFQTKNGYYLEHSVKTFSFGINNQFEYTFDYVNAALKHPDTGAFDVFHNTPLGIALIFLAFVSIGLIIAQLKKKQRTAPHLDRFM